MVGMDFDRQPRLPAVVPQQGPNGSAVEPLFALAQKERVAVRPHFPPLEQPRPDGPQFIRPQRVRGGQPPLQPGHCSTRPSRSICDNRRPQASDARSPCRNMSSKRQRSRTSLRLPFVASMLGSGLINCQKAANLVSCAQGGRHEPTFLPFCRTTRTYQALLASVACFKKNSLRIFCMGFYLWCKLRI